MLSARALVMDLEINRSSLNFLRYKYFGIAGSKKAFSIQRTEFGATGPTSNTQTPIDQSAI